ncbi:hypothetical protein ACHAXT_005460 [Thalassiosira profunda]
MAMVRSEGSSPSSLEMDAEIHRDAGNPAASSPSKERRPQQQPQWRTQAEPFPSEDSRSPISRRAMLAFLLLVGVAIIHAVASGVAHMHEPQKTQQQQAKSHPLFATKVISDNRKASATTPPEGEATASILSRAGQLSSLISHLDASDVVEVYVVTRMAPLHNVASASSGGNRRKVQRMLDESVASASNDDPGAKKEEENVPQPSIPTGPVLVRKSALAFRYRPRVASAARGHSLATDEAEQELSDMDKLEEQKYFELTLEYGPQRTGAAKTAEAMPSVHVDVTEVGTGEAGNEEGAGKFVQWENEGRVYHSSRISSEWSEAYYMAPITGVVLEKIIQRAVEYTYKRPRYQPFEVVSLPSGNLVLKSSGADDFVWDMFRDLADLYVKVDPLLVPPRGKVQFYVADPPEEGGEDGRGDGRREDDEEEGPTDGSTAKRTSRRRSHPNVRQVRGPAEGARAAAFYENFFGCATAIKTGDYSSFLPPPTAEPTLRPTLSPAPSQSSSAEEDDDDVAEADEGSDEEDGPSKQAGQGDSEIAESEGNIEPEEQDAPDALHPDEEQDGLEEDEDSHLDALDVGEIDDVANNDQPDTPAANETGSIRQRYLPSLRQLDENEDTAIDEPLFVAAVDTEGDALNDQGDVDIGDEDDDIPGLSPTNDDFMDDFIIPEEKDSEDDAAEVAEKAAIEAEKAAENAAAVVGTNSSTPADTSEVIAATNEAAKAAKKAKEATVAARSKISAEALLSGDGDLMTGVLSTCFSDPKYNIRRQEEIRHDVEPADDEGNGYVIEKRESTYAYIYLDGDVFVRLNLTAPYWGTVSALETVPLPHVPPEGKGDAIDWAIFMLILTGTLFGFVVLVHQVGLVLDKRLRFRYFFHPTMTEEDWATDEDFGGGDEQSPLKGGGFLHSELMKSPELLPTSMGGSKNQSPPTMYRDNPSLPSPEDDSHQLDLEMAERRTPIRQRDRQPSEGSEPTPSPRKMSFGESGSPAELPLSLRMKLESPDFVERTSNVSFSKVSLPKMSPITDDGQSRRVDFEKSKAPSLPLNPEESPIT